MIQEKKNGKNAPEGAKLVFNPSSAAPGFVIKNVICLPGVPSILKSMSVNLKKYLKPGLKTYSLTVSVKQYVFNPGFKYFFKLPLIDFNIEGTPGRQITFLITNPGAALEGLKTNFAPSGIFAIFFLGSLKFFSP